MRALDRVQTRRRAARPAHRARDRWASGSATVSRWSTRTYSANAAGAATDADHVGLLAVRGFAGEARQAVTAADERERGDVPTDAPRRIGVGTGGDDLAAELVAHHQAGRHRRAQLEVGAADPAGRHLQHELAGSRRRIGDVGDLELVVVVQHGGTHGATARSRRLGRVPGLPVFVSGIDFGEGPRWHDGRLWFSDFHQHTVSSVGDDGVRVVELELDDFPSGLGWLPDGRLLVVAMESRRVRPPRARRHVVTHADLSAVATGRCNDMVVAADGTAYVGNFGFELGGAARRPAALARVAPRAARFRCGRRTRVPERHGDHPRRSHARRGRDASAERATAFTVAPDGTLHDRRRLGRPRRGDARRLHAGRRGRDLVRRRRRHRGGAGARGR